MRSAQFTPLEASDRVYKRMTSFQVVATLALVLQTMHCSYIESSSTTTTIQQSEDQHRIQKRGIIATGAFPAFSIHPPPIARPLYPASVFPLPALRPYLPYPFGYPLRYPSVYPFGLVPRSLNPPDLALLPPVTGFSYASAIFK